MYSLLSQHEHDYFAQRANDLFVVGICEGAYRILTIELIKGQYWFTYPEIKEIHKYNGEYWFEQHKGGIDGMMSKAITMHSISLKELVGTKIKHIAEPEYAINGRITGNGLRGTSYIGTTWGYIPITDKKARRLGYPHYWNKINDLIL